MRKVTAPFLLLTMVVLTGSYAMAQESTPTLEELQKQIESLKKQKELLDAQKLLIDAQKALLAVQQPESPLASEVAAAKAAKELADAKKASADAQKAVSDAELAAFKASLGDASASGIAGTVEAKENTGELEAALLAMKAVEEAAEKISARVRAVLGPSNIVVITAAEVPTFTNLLAYDTEVAIVREVLTKAIASAKPPVAGATVEAVPILGAAGLALDATSKLLSFFRSDFVAKGVSVTLEDTVALNSISGTLARDESGKHSFNVLVPTIYDPTSLANNAKFFVDDVASLGKLRGEAQGLVRSLETQIAEFKAAVEAEKAESKTKAALEEQLGMKTKLLSGLESALALMDAWYTKLGAPDSKGVAAIVNVAKEKAIFTSISDGSLMVVKVQKTGGAWMSKKNLWTFFGGMPLFHTGGAAVSFTLLDGKTGVVKAAGVVPVHGGFVKAGKMRRSLGP